MPSNFLISGNKDIIYIAESFAREKNIDINAVIDALESGLKLVVLKKYGKDTPIECNLDKKSGKIVVYTKLLIVENSKEKEIDFDNKKYVTLSNALKYVKENKATIDGKVEIGNYIYFILPNIELNRINIQIVKNELIKKIKDAESDEEYNAFINKKGTISTGLVERIDARNIYVSINGYIGTLPLKEILPNERYRIGDRVRFYIKNVIKALKGSQIFLSRTDNLFMLELFKQEVPEIFDDVIKVVDIVRDPGSKAKISVYSKNETVDVIGACIGIRGTRVQAVTNELKGEKIDIVKYSDDPIEYVVNAVATVKPIRVIYDKNKNSANFIVDESQLSLAIGRSGQNVRLATKLTSIEIKILTEKEEKEFEINKLKTEISNLMEQLDIDETIANLLVMNGFNTVDVIAGSDVEKLEQIQEFNKEIAEEIINRAIDYMNESEE